METSRLENLAQPEAHYNLSDFHSRKADSSLKQRIQPMYGFINSLAENQQLPYHRIVTSAHDREVTVYDDLSNTTSKMLMFGSNNYLGYANHPYIHEKVRKDIKKYGVGIGGPPILNGHTGLMAELEERLASLKHQEKVIIYPSGYAANLGLASALMQSNDRIIYDSLSHASLIDGLRMSGCSPCKLNHNNLDNLEEKLISSRNSCQGEVFVAVEGVYSMDGDLAPLDKVVELADQYDATLVLDDAHGTCILGNSGAGTAEYFGVSDRIDISMGTFSKAFAMNGGYVASSKEIVNYLQYSSRPYMFSAALPTSTLSAVLGGLDLLETEPWLRKNLLDNVHYARQKLASLDVIRNPQAGIISLKIPAWLDVRKAGRKLHQLGLFINAVEYPAVRKEEQRFRITFMAQHTREDIDLLCTGLEEVWNDPALAK